MTDYEKLRAMLTEFGVECTVNLSMTSVTITIQEGGSKVDGHEGCYTEFLFGADGKFISMGAWESRL